MSAEQTPRCDGSIVSSATARYLLRRVGRRLLWPYPSLYAPVGFLKRGLNVLESEHQIYIDGYPRSGNTFALKAFLLANPGIAVRSRRHIPTFIIQSAKRNEPGMVLIRNPIDAAVSWAIYRNKPLRYALAYYNDYYSVLLKYQERLFFVSFEKLISDFGQIIREFNDYWDTDSAPFEHTPANMAACMAQIEQEYTDARGKISEFEVPRPSALRKPLKEQLLSQISKSHAIQRELGKAMDLFNKLVPRVNTRPQLDLARAASTTTSHACISP